MVKIRYEALSYVGRRSNNQDNVIAAQYNDRLWFFAVADGMGGAMGGDKASEIVVETAAKYLNQWASVENLDPSALKEILLQIYVEGQKNINEFVENNPDLKGMGTTFTSLLVYDDKYVFGNIGDSRLYRLSEQNIEAITEDHSAVKEYEKKYGKDVPDDIVQKYGHILTKTMDGGEDKPDIYPLEEDFEQVHEGQMFLICSDGLILEKSPDNTEYNEVLNHYISAADSLRKAAENLVSFAYNAGSSDNISVVLAEIGEYERLETDYKNLSFPPGDIDVATSDGNDHTIVAEKEPDNGEYSNNKKRKNRNNFIRTLIAGFSFLLVFLLLMVTNVISVNWDAFKRINETENKLPSDSLKDNEKQKDSTDILQEKDQEQVEKQNSDTANEDREDTTKTNDKKPEEETNTKSAIDGNEPDNETEDQD